LAIGILIAALSMAALVFQLASRARAWGAPGSLTVRSLREPREIRRAARRFFHDGGWIAGTQTSRAETFSHRLRPAGPEVALLLLLGILPGLLYLLLGRSTVNITVVAEADDRGSTTLVSWSNGGECERACRGFASMIRDQEPTRRSDSETPRRRRHARTRRDAATRQVKSN